MLMWLIFIQWWKWPIFTRGTLVGDVFLFYILNMQKIPLFMYTICIAFGGYYVDKRWKSYFEQSAIEIHPQREREA